MVRERMRAGPCAAVSELPEDPAGAVDSARALSPSPRSLVRGVLSADGAGRRDVPKGPAGERAQAE